MKTLFWKAAGLLLFLLILAGAVRYAEQVGYRQGYTDAELAAVQLDNSRFSSLLSRTSLLLQESNQVSDRLLQRIQQQAELGRQTTEDLRYVLAETAASRIDCRLPADGLQQLRAARERAATAVSASSDTRRAQSTLPDPGGGQP